MLSLRTGTKAAIRHEIVSSCLADAHWPAAESSKRQSHRLPNESPQRPFSSSSAQRGKSRIARPAGSKKEQILLNAFRFAEQLQPITSPSPAPDDKSRKNLEAADLDLPLKEPSIDTQIRKSMWPLENLYKHNSNIATHDKRYKKAYKEVLTRIGHSFTTIQLRSILRELSDGRLKSKEAKSMQKTIALQQVMLAYGWQTPTDAGPEGQDNVPLVKKIFHDLPTNELNLLARERATIIDMMANASLTFSLVPAAAVAGEAKEVQSGDRMLLQAEGPERGINLLTKKLELRKEHLKTAIITSSEMSGFVPSPAILDEIWTTTGAYIEPWEGNYRVSSMNPRKVAVGTELLQVAGLRVAGHTPIRYSTLISPPAPELPGAGAIEQLVSLLPFLPPPKVAIPWSETISPGTLLYRLRKITSWAARVGPAETKHRAEKIQHSLVRSMQGGGSVRELEAVVTESRDKLPGSPSTLVQFGHYVHPKHSSSFAGLEALSSAIPGQWPIRQSPEKLAEPERHNLGPPFFWPTTTPAMTHDIPKAEPKHLRRLRYFSPTTLQSLTFTYTYPAQKRSERERKPAPKKMGKGSWMEQLEAMIRGMDKSKAMSVPAEQPEEVQEEETPALEQEESVPAESTAQVESHDKESNQEMSDDAVAEAIPESTESGAVEATSSEEVVEEPSSNSEQVVDETSAKSDVQEAAAQEVTADSFGSEVIEERSEVVGEGSIQENASAVNNNEPQSTETITSPHFTRDPRVTVLYTAVVSGGSEIDMMMPDRPIDGRMVISSKANLQQYIDPINIFYQELTQPPSPPAEGEPEGEPTPNKPKDLPRAPFKLLLHPEPLIESPTEFILEADEDLVVLESHSEDQDTVLRWIKSKDMTVDPSISKDRRSIYTELEHTGDTLSRAFWRELAHISRDVPPGPQRHDT